MVFVTIVPHPESVDTNVVVANKWEVVAGVAPVAGAVVAVAGNSFAVVTS